MDVLSLPSEEPQATVDAFQCGMLHGSTFVTVTNTHDITFTKKKGLFLADSFGPCLGARCEAAEHNDFQNHLAHIWEKRRGR